MLSSKALEAGRLTSCLPATAEANINDSSVASRMATMWCFVDVPMDVVARPILSPTFQPIALGSKFRNNSVEPALAVRLSKHHVRAMGSPWMSIVLLCPLRKRSP